MGWQRGTPTTRPSWLQAALSDLEHRFQTLSVHSPDNVHADADSFADRAENYYRKRPQLLALLHDLYGRYQSLADRYTQALLKTSANCSVSTSRGSHCQSQSQVSLVPSDLEDAETVVTDLTPDDDAACREYHFVSSSSDNESSMSFHFANVNDAPSKLSADALVADLVSRLVEADVLRHELSLLDRRQGESARKLDLQASLLEVLESERLVLLTENARLAFQAKAAAEENQGLAAEVGFMRRRAGELARCVVNLREDHRVCVLGRKIEALQAQIYGLENRNRECYEVMARREEEKAELVRAVCAELQTVKAENKRLTEAAAPGNRPRRCAKPAAMRTPHPSFPWGRQVVRKLEEWMACGGGAHMAKHDS